MPAQIRVQAGPDEGETFVLGPGTTRVSSRPDADVQLSDAAFQRGELRIDLRNDAYHVTNLLGHSIYLENAEFPDRESRLWYTAVPLQPTQATVLVLEPADPAPKAAAKKAGRKAGEKKKLDNIPAEWVLGGIGLVLGLLILSASKTPPDPNAKLSEAGINRRVERGFEQLGRDQADAVGNPTLKAAFAKLESEFRKARQADYGGRDREALDYYLKSRDALKRAAEVGGYDLDAHRRLTGEEKDAISNRELLDALVGIGRVVNQRIIELSTPS